MNPAIEGIPVQLGDIVSNPKAEGSAIPFAEATRVKGWSPDGSKLLLDWVGVASTKDCKWVTEIDKVVFPRRYKPAKENRWA